MLAFFCVNVRYSSQFSNLCFFVGLGVRYFRLITKMEIGLLDSVAFFVYAWFVDGWEVNRGAWGAHGCGVG